MMCGQFTHRIGRMLVSIALGLAMVAFSGSVAEAQAGPFSLSPASGRTTPGGRLNFDLIANPNNPLVYTNMVLNETRVTVLPAANISVNFNWNAPGTVQPGVWNGGTIYVGAGVASGTYTVTIVLLVFTDSTGPTSIPYFLNYTLQVGSGAPSPGSSPVPSPLPGPTGSLQAFISTDRGCQERGQNPVYSSGDPITVFLRVSGVGATLVTIEDITADGQTRVLVRQMVPGNQMLLLRGQITPPLGRETLRLTAPVGNQILRSECSFTVAG